MKKFLHYLCIACAVIALIMFIYQVVPVFPYVKDAGIFFNFLIVAFFYYLAYKTSDQDERGFTTW